MIRRRWRQFCGILRPPDGRDPQRVLFSAKETTVPPVRISTRQLDALIGQQVVVNIDSWPVNSKYPLVSLYEPAVASIPSDRPSSIN